MSRRIWQVALVAGLALPIGAYVAGSLAASSTDTPQHREPIVIREAPTPAGADDDASGVVAPEPAEDDDRAGPRGGGDRGSGDDGPDARDERDDRGDDRDDQGGDDDGDDGDRDDSDDGDGDDDGDD